MELHFIILTTLCAILLLFIILAICAYCCGDFCCNCGNSSYSHSRESYRNETVTTGTKTSSKGEFHSEHYSNNGQILPSLLPSPHPEFEIDENHSTPLLKEPRKPLGFGYPVETPQEEVGEIPYSNAGFYPPAETVATISYPGSQSTPYQQNPDNARVTHHVETISYTGYPPNKQNNTAVVEVNGKSHSVVINPHQVTNTAPLPNQNTPSSSAQIPTLDKTPYQSNIKTVHHVKTTSNAPYRPSKQIYLSDIDANELSYPVATDSQQSSLPTNFSHSETQSSRMVTMPAKQRMRHHQDSEIAETTYHVETGSYAPVPSSKHIYSSTTETNEIAHPVGNSYRYAPTKNGYIASDSQSIETACFTRSGSCPPSNIIPGESARHFYPLEPHRNKTNFSRTVTYSSDDIVHYPISIKVANSVELLPTLDSEVPYNQTQIGKSPLKKQSSQVSLYDNV